MSTSTQQDRPTVRRQTQPPPIVPVLWQLQISHYVEKVRWALDYKRVPHVRRTLLPGLHAHEGQAPDRRYLDHAGAHHRRAVYRRLDTDHRRHRGALATAAALSRGSGAAASRA